MKTEKKEEKSTQLIEKWIADIGNPMKINRQLYEALVKRANQMEQE